MIFKAKASDPSKNPGTRSALVGQADACPAAKELRDKRYLGS